jgi:hypothetical protein
MSIHQSSTGIERLADPFISLVTQQVRTMRKPIGVFYPWMIAFFPFYHGYTTVKTLAGISFPCVKESSFGYGR